MPGRFALPLILVAVLLPPPYAQAGLYCSGESYAALPSQWRGFLLDQRALRNIAVRPMPGQDPSPLRVKYQQDAQKLQQQLDQEKKLPTDSWADLVALYVRLGEPAKPVEV